MIEGDFENDFITIIDLTNDTKRLEIV